MTNKPPDPDHGVPYVWHTFLDTPPSEADRERSRVVVLPVPYDSTTSYKTGSREGPSAIIRASRQLEDYDLELDRDISTVGVHTTPEIEPHVGSPEQMVERVHRAANPWVSEGNLVVTLGGEHTVTLGAVRAFAERYADLSVLYLDAHADMRDEYMGSKFSHACVARRIREICPVVNVGVRSVCEEEIDIIRQQRLPVHFWDGTANIEDIVASVSGELSDHVYVSIDLDVFDPSMMASVGTPEPGGMLWNDVLRVLRAVGESKTVVGFDVVELSPPEGPEACVYTAAKLVHKMIGYCTEATRD